MRRRVATKHGVLIDVVSVCWPTAYVVGGDEKAIEVLERRHNWTKGIMHGKERMRGADSLGLLMCRTLKKKNC